VVVNLYPFRETVAKRDCTLDDAIENIDIGGPAMVRSAAKNWAHVGVVVDPADYAPLAVELARTGALSDATAFALARKAFAHTAAYDGAIANWLTARSPDGTSEAFPQSFRYAGERVQSLRYGENPHQSAAFYRDEAPAPGTIATFRQRQGKELSYNNIADADAAWECVKSMDTTACVIVKHANPCGVATGPTTLDAYRRAFSTDPTSAFGGIIAFNRPVDAATLEAVAGQFVEVLIAPAYTDDAIGVIAQKKNVRVLEVALPGASRSPGPVRFQARGRRPARPDDGREAGRARRSQGGHAPRPDPRAARRPDVRVARRQVRQVERDRLRGGWHDARHRRRPDEPRRLGAHRGDQGRDREARPGRLGGRVRCVLPVPRRPRRRRGPGRDGRDPARRQHARRRGDRGRRRARLAMVFTGVRHFRH
jgi:hypothetical protein